MKVSVTFNPDRTVRVSLEPTREQEKDLLYSLGGLVVTGPVRVRANDRVRHYTDPYSSTLQGVEVLLSEPIPDPRESE